MSEVVVTSSGGRHRLLGAGPVVEAGNAFLRHLESRGYSPATVRGYAHDLLSFCRFCLEQSLSLTEVTQADCFAWLEWQRSARAKSPAASTMNRRVAALRGLYEHAVISGRCATSPVPNARRAGGLRARGMLGHLPRRNRGGGALVREQKRLPEALGPAEVGAFLADLDTHRDRAITLALVTGGLRACEVRRLRLCDVDFGLHQLRVLGKGGRERVVPIDHGFFTELTAYPRHRAAGGLCGRRVLCRAARADARKAHKRGRAEKDLPCAPPALGGGAGAPAPAAAHLCERTRRRRHGRRRAAGPHGSCLDRGDDTLCAALAGCARGGVPSARSGREGDDGEPQVAPPRRTTTFLSPMRPTARCWRSPRGRARRLQCARDFLTAHPDLTAWMRRPIALRITDLETLRGAQCLVAFVLASGAVRADMELLRYRRVPELARTVERLHRDDLDVLRTAASRLALADGWTKVVLAEVLPIAVAVCGKAPRVDADDLGSLGAQIVAASSGRSRHARLSNELRSLWRMLYEAGILDRPAPAKKGRPIVDPLSRVSTEAIRSSIASYLDARAAGAAALDDGHCSARNLAIFGEFCSRQFPELSSLADLERRHVEAYCAFLTGRPWRSPWGRGRVVGPQSVLQGLVALRNFLDDISSWGWREAPPRRLVFATDLPRQPKPLPRALPPDQDAALMAAVADLEDPFTRDGLIVLRGTGLRIGELLDLELTSIVDYREQGVWLKVPLGKMNDERFVPIEGQGLAAMEDWLAHRLPCRPLPRPRDGRLVDFVFVEHGERLDEFRLQKAVRTAVRAAGLKGPDGTPLRVVIHQLRHTYAISLLNAGLSLPALMALLGHRTPEMTLRYARLSSPTLRRAYDEAMGKLRPRIPLAPVGRPAMSDKLEWLASEMLKTRLAHGYCARELVAEACPYANVCENCANFVAAPEFAPILNSQLADVRRLRDDVKTKGWDSEVARHEHVIESLEGHLRRLRP